MREIGWLGDWLWVFGAFKWRWMRKLYGGHWECWWTEVVYSFIWEPVEKCSVGSYRRPPCAFGSPTCEEWPTTR
jgi:hypothetical protein